MSDETFMPMEESAQKSRSQSAWQENKAVIIGGIAGLVILIIIIALVYAGATHPAETAIVRDMMIIFMAFVSLLIGIALMVLIYQLAALTNLLRGEIKPLLESANETMDTLRGTAVFMSDNVVEPTIQASSTIAGVQRVLQVLFDLRPPSSPKSKP